MTDRSSTVPPSQRSPAQRAARDATQSEALIDAVEFLGRMAGVEVERIEIRRALDAVRSEDVFTGSDAWFTQLKRAARAVGLNARILRASPASLCAGGGRRELPLVTIAAGDERTNCIAVLEHRVKRLLVIDPTNAAQERWVDAEELSRLAGTVGVDEPVLFVYANPLRPMHLLEKVDESDPTPSPFARVLGLLRLERDDVGVAIIYAIAIGIASLVVPVGVQMLVNTVAFGGLLQPVLILSLLVFAGLVFEAVLRGLQAWVIERLQQRVFARVAMDLAHRLARVRVSALDGRNGPELVNRYFDVFTVQKGAASLLVDGVSIVMQMTVGLLILAFYHPLLLAFDLILLAVLATLLVITGRGAVDASIKKSKAKYAVAGWLQEMVRHPTIFRGAGCAGYAARRAEDLTRNYIEMRKRRFRYLFRQIVSSLGIAAIASAGLLAVGGYLVIEGQLTLGQLVAAELIVAVFAAGAAKLGKQLESFYDLLAAVDKLGQLVDLPLETQQGAVVVGQTPGASLRLSKVAFSYPGGPEILHEIDLALPAGGHAAVLGINGQGKSTLVDIVFGMRQPTRGSVDFDGMDLRNVDLDSLREQVVLIRGIEIFDGTISENVRVGRELVTVEDVRKALESVGLWDEIASMPDGLDTLLASGGSILSVGQARRLMIARALVGRPRLILLDESLDNLDAQARASVFSSIFSKDAPWSVLVTTHDREALRASENIYVLDSGQLRPLRAGDAVI